MLYKFFPAHFTGHGSVHNRYCTYSFYVQYKQGFFFSDCECISANIWDSLWIPESLNFQNPPSRTCSLLMGVSKVDFSFFTEGDQTRVSYWDSVSALYEPKTRKSSQRWVLRAESEIVNPMTFFCLSHNSF